MNCKCLKNVLKHLLGLNNDEVSKQVRIILNKELNDLYTEKLELLR
jgi:hypothetical protein